MSTCKEIHRLIRWLHSINRHVLICNIIHTSTKHSAKTTKHTASNMTKLFTCLLTVALLALASSLASAHDPSSLQDFCVAVNNSNSAGMYLLYYGFLGVFSSYLDLVFSVIISHINENFMILGIYILMELFLEVILYTWDLKKKNVHAWHASTIIIEAAHSLY